MLPSLLLCGSLAFTVPLTPHKPQFTQQQAATTLERLNAVAPSVARAPVVEMMAEGKPLKVGVVGVTGAVGQEIINVMHKRGFAVSELKLFASKRSAGTEMETPFGPQMIEEFELEAARACDVLFLAVSGDFALEWVPKLTAEGGPLVIDNSSAYRYDDTVPLVVPEINADAARKSTKKLVANPNCTTAIALMALAPLHKEFGIKRCIMSTYQAASGAGAPGSSSHAVHRAPSPSASPRRNGGVAFIIH